MTEGSLACLSCNPTGEGTLLSGAELSPEIVGEVIPLNRAGAGAFVDGDAIDGALPENLSASGTRVFFQSQEPLLPEAVNGTDPREKLHQRTHVRQCL